MALRKLRRALLDILLWELLKFPDCLTDVLSPEKATSSDGFENLLISPISATMLAPDRAWQRKNDRI